MLSIEEVRHIAELARIGVTDEEAEKYRRNLSSVLDFFRELERLPTDGIEPIGHITGRVNVARTDRIDGFGAEGSAAIVANFPDRKAGFLKVKSVF